MEKFNLQVNSILLTLQAKLAQFFGQTTIDRKTVLQLAKELGYLEGKRGREGGTFATEMGMAFANLSGEIIKPVPKAKTKVSLTLAESELCPMACVDAITPVVVSATEVP